MGDTVISKRTERHLLSYQNSCWLMDKRPLLILELKGSKVWSTMERKCRRKHIHRVKKNVVYIRKQLKHCNFTDKKMCSMKHF